MDDINTNLAPHAINSVKQDAHVLNELKKMNKKTKQLTLEDDPPITGLEAAAEAEDQDDQYEMQEYNPAAKDQSENKAIFRANYGYEQKLPAVYVLDAKIFPLEPDYMIKIVKYVIPEDGLPIRTYPCNGEPNEVSMKELHNHPDDEDIYQKDSLVLQLMKRKGQILEITKETAISNAERVNITFSPDGRYFALIRNKKHILQVYKVNKQNDIIAMMEKIKRDKPIFEIK